MPTARLSSLEAIRELREEYLRAMSAQVVHDAWHRRGFTTIYLMADGSDLLGYGAVGGAPGAPHETVKEFYLRPAYRHDAPRLFAAFLAGTHPRRIEAQTNDPFLAPLLPRFAPDHTAWAYLFADAGPTRLANPGARLRPVTADDHAAVFAHTTEPIGDWGLEQDGSLVATGGLFFHYNKPYGDIYMEVAPAHRRRGYGSYLVQELRRIAHEGGHVPAARCNIENAGSRKALERAGMRVCGQLVGGPVVT